MIPKTWADTLMTRWGFHGYSIYKIWSSDQVFTWSSAYFFGDFWTTGDMRWNRTYAVGRERTCMCELGNWAQKFGTSHSIYFAIGHRRHDILSIETNTTTPLGILNLLSFLYHKDPLSLFIILTGYSVSGQSEVLRAKSVAGGEKINKDNWKQSTDTVRSNNIKRRQLKTPTDELVFSRQVKAWV